jgi:Tfp pilus assembly protein PilZ
LPVRYRSGGVSLDGRAFDLSQDGIFFMTPFLDDTNGDIALEIDLPDSPEPLRVEGQIRWVDEAPLHAGMGIRFTNVAIRERLLLANYMLRRHEHR